jgi:hypothetical protein
MALPGGKTMKGKAKVVARPSSTICLPVGACGATVTIAQILNAAGIATNGTLNANVESFRLVGGEFKAAATSTADMKISSVQYEDGQTFEIMDPYHSVKLKISDRNPLGFWKSDTAGNAFSIAGNADCVSFTIAVRYRQVSFQ